MNKQAKNSLEAVLNEVVSFVLNETHLLARYEAVLQQELGRLIQTGGDEAFGARMNRVVEHLGGPPEFYLLFDHQEPPPADNYPEAIMREAFAVFYRARSSVLRAHLYMTGSSVLTGQPDLSDAPQDVTDVFVKEAQGAFWEHAEAAYIRLSSFWDRVGQVLDFSFFNIRKFDQNGFTAVMDRIHANAIPMDIRLKSSLSWKRLRTFQTNEKEDGLKWLLQRRNLVVHSLHLHPVGTDDEGVFKSQFNHLDAAHREKLRPREPSEEVQLLIGQLEKASTHFSDFLDIVELTPSRKRESYL
ncbi:hypothetical protein CV770_28410 [Bradyrhizobium sp. AC87j1]|uniref:hypothetical protein n=1 Tax=Bradyrhizobium sp. AC87j1 TaxID=2055894 RepID=UPI000CEBFDB7|nr:hypothetical protein [Bradyrhizobium sp. AC87j1]PPQ16056.1 hypothetical protein CV770_28410 [Bradyrhizobium sp. AC87j1]